MSVMTEKTVGELALEHPGATRVFEKLGIDYCCGGGRTLAEACQAAHLSISQVTDSLAASRDASAMPPVRNWQADPCPSCSRISGARTTFTRARRLPG